MEDELQITLTNDYAFKRLLGSEENKPLLQDLLECILDLSREDVSELELMDIRVYRKTRVLPFGKTSLLLNTSGIRAASEMDFCK